MWKGLVAWVLGLTILILLVVELMVLGGTALAYSGEHPDPFELYAAIEPGQPVEALKAYSCRWQEGTGDMTANCEIALHTKSFEKVTVVLSLRDAKIQQLRFSPDGLYMGDLWLLWGRPYVSERYGPDCFIARWRRGAGVYIAQVRGPSPYDLRSPVISVAVT